MTIFLIVLVCLVTMMQAVMVRYVAKKQKALEERFNGLECSYSKIVLIFRDVVKKNEENEEDLLKLQQDILLFMSTMEEVLVQKETQSKKDIVDVLNRADKQKLN
jgi:Na+-transporting methylmalonyl-CoA/oxaloacetate decarboxylase gamma subunit